MSKFHFISLILFLAGIFFMFAAFLSGDIEGGFFIIFPFLIGSGVYAFLAILFIFLALITFAFGTLESLGEFPGEDMELIPERTVNKKVEGGGVLLIGPIPIIFGTSWRISFTLLILTLLIFSLALLILFLSLKI